MKNTGFTYWQDGNDWIGYLDENLPRPLKLFFPADEAVTVQEVGWAGLKNGELLAKTDGHYDILVIADRT